MPLQDQADGESFAAGTRARMMAMVKVLLAKYKYPPDKQPEATEKVIAQAELLADTWADESR